MQSSIYLISLLAAVFHCSLANPANSCPLVDKTTSEIMTAINENVEMCVQYLYEPENPEEFWSPPNVEVARTNFRTYCNNSTALFAECVAAIEPYAESCLDPHHLQVYQVNRDNWKGGVRIACSDMGERVAVIIGNRNAVGSEKAACGRLLDSRNATDKDPAQSSSRMYRAIGLFQRCMSDIPIHDEATAAMNDALTSFATDIREMMKCVSPETGAATRCKNLDTANIV